MGCLKTAVEREDRLKELETIKESGTHIDGSEFKNGARGKELH